MGPPYFYSHLRFLRLFLSPMDRFFPQLLTESDQEILVLSQRETGDTYRHLSVDTVHTADSGSKMPTHEMFVVVFDVAQDDPKQWPSWETFIQHLLTSEQWRATRFDTWFLGGYDWGWMFSSVPRGGDIARAATILKDLGFVQSACLVDPEIARFNLREGTEEVINRLLGSSVSEGNNNSKNEQQRECR